MQDNYVISLGSIDKLNDIMTKYYNKWKQTKYVKEFRLGGMGEGDYGVTIVEFK